MTGNTLVNLAVDAAIAHIISGGCDDIFKPPTFSDSLEHTIILANQLEFEADAATACAEFFAACDLRVSRIGDIHHSLVLKDHFTFRKVSWIDPFDLVKFLALCILLFEKIEQARIDRSLGIIHSHRMLAGFSPLFDPDYGYNSFRKKSGELSRANIGKWKVVTDIANFFDRIGNHPLENHLIDCGCERTYIELAREILFFWAGDRRSFGVPIGSDASRILCEAALITVDRKLQEAGIIFLRYVDDIRIFSESRAEAYRAVELLITLLAEEGLSLNSKKTEIYKIVTDDEDASDLNVIKADVHQPLDGQDTPQPAFGRTVSNRSALARFYKAPGEQALRGLKKISLEDVLAEIENVSDSAFEEAVRKAIKYFIYVKQDLTLVTRLLEKRVTSVFYIVDALIKENEKLSEALRQEVQALIGSQVDPLRCAYPLLIPLLRLAAHPAYEDSRVICSVIDRQKVTDNPLFLREAIMLGYNQIDRARLRNMAQHQFKISPDFLKRAILYAVKHSTKIDQAEKRPLIKNMKQASGDWFLKKI